MNAGVCICPWGVEMTPARANPVYAAWVISKEKPLPVAAETMLLIVSE